MTLPKPLQYALSAVVIAIGFAVAYQVALGEAFKYKGVLGDIEIGSGANKTTITMQQFLNDSEAALREARDTIGGQEGVIAQLQQTLTKYEAELVSLKKLTARLKAANSQTQRTRVNDAISRKLATIDVSELSVAKMATLSTVEATKLRLEEQAKLTSQVKNKVKKR